MLQVGVGRQVNIFLHFAIRCQQLESALRSDIKTVVFSLGDYWSLDHVTRAESLFVLLVGKDVLACDHCLGRAVFAWFSRGERHDFAGELPLHH